MTRATVSAVAAIVLLVGYASVVSASALRNPTARYVLTARDLGPGYQRNSANSGPRSLADVSAGDNLQVRKELRRSWLGGTVAAFNKIPGQSGVVSIADVFKSGARIGLVLGAWERDALAATHGRTQVPPKGAPGSRPVIIRGTLITYEVLIYMWMHGRTIASVDVTGPLGTPRISRLLALARRQDGKIRH